MREIDEQAPRQTTQECPRCGSHLALVRFTFRDRKSGRAIDTDSRESLFWSVLALVISTLLLNVLLPSLNRDEFGTSQFAGPLPVWTPFVLAFVVLVVLEARRVFRLESAIRVQTFRCRSCRYRWDLGQR